MGVVQDIYFDSCGAGKIRARIWSPEETPRAVVQIVHGIAEHVERYDDYAQFLCKHGIAVVGEDHMGHGKSVASDGVKGYFHGGWFAAVEDAVKLMGLSRERFGDIPYVLFGHSMGSFMARTILAKYPELKLSGCIICGTAWQPKSLLSVGVPMIKGICRMMGEKKPSPALHKAIFGSYNKRVEHVRTPSDWLSRDNKTVDAYEADPMCGFVPSAGLLRDMMLGISYIQEPDSLAGMNKSLPCWFIAGGDDPVGAYGKGVEQAVQAFRSAGMEQVDVKLYPLGRHEILNEINRDEVYADTLEWISARI